MEQDRITAPLSRFIGVADFPRAIAFYRDVLGFEPRSDNELVYGPARIMLGEDDYAPDDPQNPKPRGSAMLFLETDNIVGMRDRILARGGKPSEIEKVNWIKMQMFQIEDPDGHVIWFGQSYQQPDLEKPTPMLEKSLPEMPCDDVAAAVQHYCDALGFQINYQQDDIAVMYRDNVTVLLIARTEKHTGIGSAYFYIRDADALYAEMKSNGANAQKEPVSQPWGLREFDVLDWEGNRLRFGQPFE